MAECHDCRKDSPGSWPEGRSPVLAHLTDMHVLKKFLSDSLRELQNQNGDQDEQPGFHSDSGVTNCSCPFSVTLTQGPEPLLCTETTLRTTELTL